MIFGLEKTRFLFNFRFFKFYHKSDLLQCCESDPIELVDMIKSAKINLDQDASQIRKLSRELSKNSLDSNWIMSSKESSMVNLRKNLNSGNAHLVKSYLKLFLNLKFRYRLRPICNNSSKWCNWKSRNFAF